MGTTLTPTVLIDGVDIENEMGARLKSEYTVTGLPITNEYIQGRNRTEFNLLSSVWTLKEITLPLVIHGKNHAEISRKKTELVRICFGKKELFLPDGFFYTAMLTGAGDIVWNGPFLGEFSLIFLGMQHGALITTSGHTVYCESTISQTDCILTATVSTAADTYQLGEALFTDVNAGDVLTMDGIHKRVLVNGAPGALKCQWLHFPFLVPGENQITCPDDVTVSYYPCYA